MVGVLHRVGASSRLQVVCEEQPTAEPRTQLLLSASALRHRVRLHTSTTKMRCRETISDSL